MTSVFGGAQTVPQTQQTSQAINQATTQQQNVQTAQAQAQQQTIQPSQQTQGVGNQLQGYLTDIATGFNPVPGAMQIAPLTGQQTGAINQLVDTGMGMQPLVGQGQQFLGQGAGFMGQAGQAITPQDINSFYNPMAGNVTAQLQNIFGQQNLANRLGATAASGGIGGDRAAVAQGILANQQTLGAGQIYSQLYQNALQAAQQQKAQQLAAGQGLAGTAFPTMQAGIGGLGTALQAATIPQQQQQQVNQAQYQAAQQAYQDLFLRAQALQGGIGPMNQAFGVTTTGTGMQGGQTLGQMLGTLSGSQLGTGLGTTTYPAPAVLPQVAGLGSLALGAAGLFGLSDRKEKTDIKKLGVHKPTGLPLYAYRYKGDPKTYPKVVGPMAQDVAKIHPDLVARLPKRQSGGSVLALPTAANWQSQVQPRLAQGMAFQPLFSASMPSPGGGGTGVSVNVGGGGGGGGGSSGGPQYSWAPGHPVDANTSALLAAQPASFWQGVVDNQNLGLGRINFGGAPGAKRGGRIQGYQDAGPIVSDEESDDSEPDSDTDDDTAKVDFTKYAKGMNLLNQYAKSATPKTPQVQPLKMPDTPWRLGQIPVAAAMSMQRGGDADGDSAKTVPSADPDLAALRFEQTANLVQGHEVPPFQKGFPGGGRVKGYADAGPVNDDGEDEHEPAGLPEDTGDDSEDTTDTVPMPLPRPEGAGFGQGRQMLPPPGGGRMLPRAGGGLPGGMMQSPYMALMQAGLGMLAASGQRDARGLPISPLGAIGAGGMAGINTLQQQQQLGLKQRALDESMAIRRDQLNALEQHRRALEATAAQRANRPVVLEDDDGNKYLADPNTGEPIRKAATQAESASAGFTDEAAQPATKSESGNVVLDGQELIPGNNMPEGSHPEALVGNEKVAGTVRAIIDGRMNPASLPRGKLKAKIMNLVNKVDPSWDQANWTLRNKTSGDWAPNGKSGQSMTSFNFALRHTSELGRLTAGLNPNQLRQINATRNWIKTQFSDPQIEAWRNQALIVATEVPKMLRGAGVLNEQEEARWNERLLSSPKTETFLAGLGQIGHAMNARNDEMAQQYRDIMKKEPPYRLSRAAQSAAQQLEQWRLEGLGIKPGAFGPKQPTESDRQALDWANAHSSDPRARAIKEKLGVQ